jgi:hypothetical protein
MVDGEPCAMMGVVPRNMLEGSGTPWMLGSEQIYDSARLLVRYGPGIIAEMRASFERLENMVHVENDRAIRFLRHFGWTISEQREAIGGIDFVRFYDVRPGEHYDGGSDRRFGRRPASIGHVRLTGRELPGAGRPAEQRA